MKTSEQFAVKKPFGDKRSSSKILTNRIFFLQHIMSGLHFDVISPNSSRTHKDAKINRQPYRMHNADFCPNRQMDSWRQSFKWMKHQQTNRRAACYGPLDEWAIKVEQTGRQTTVVVVV